MVPAHPLRQPRDRTARSRARRLGSPGVSRVRVERDPLVPPARGVPGPGRHRPVDRVHARRSACRRSGRAGRGHRNGRAGHRRRQSRRGLGHRGGRVVAFGSCGVGQLPSARCPGDRAAGRPVHVGRGPTLRSRSHQSAIRACARRMGAPPPDGALLGRRIGRPGPAGPDLRRGRWRTGRERGAAAGAVRTLRRGRDPRTARRRGTRGRGRTQSPDPVRPGVADTRSAAPRSPPTTSWPARRGAARDRGPAAVAGGEFGGARARARLVTSGATTHPPPTVERVRPTVSSITMSR
jgi:hypothetical protein